MLTKLLEAWSLNESFAALTAKIEKATQYRAAITGFDGSARAYFIAALAFQTGRPTLVVSPDTARAEKTYANLEALYPGEVHFLPARELFVGGDVLSRSGEYQQLRLQFYQWLFEQKQGIFVTTGPAVASKTLSPRQWGSLVIVLKPGLELDRRQLIEKLVDVGYERVSLTESAGQFSARGDVIDIFPPASGIPLRLDLFDNRLESLRELNPSTQRSGSTLPGASILPAVELLASSDLAARGESLIKGELDRALTNLRRRGEKDAASRLKQQVSRHLERLARPGGLDLLSAYFPYYYGRGSSLLDYLSPHMLVIVDEPSVVAESVALLGREVEDYNSAAVIEGEMLAFNSDILFSGEELFARPCCPLLGCALFSGPNGLAGVKDAYSFEAKSAPSYHGQWELFLSDCRNWKASGYTVILSTASAARGNSLQEMLSGYGPSRDDKPGGENPASSLPTGLLPLPLIVGPLEEGFTVPALKLALVTEQNLLPGKKKKRRIAGRTGIPLGDYRELTAGDYVVHEQHGIGRYKGLSALEIGGVKRDYLLLQYRGTDRLYIPTDQVGMIRKYSGSGGPPPRLHSLGGGEWQRLKNRVDRSVEELARELLLLYAARQAIRGYAFGADHAWQQEFEARFSFEETPDQLKSIEDVKADMEKSHPMDRLICGDVGYGKTEVAMRAAFKAALEGKQVAVLAPTTVLTQQHYRTFTERFANFPVRVAQLSRFVSAAEQKNVVRELAAGKIDIIIGTHRLLSKDVRFFDLGLLVIDEEQRFGVRQKEKLKQLRLEVDTLPMTATPIPRTMHLSLAGARDISVIDTPPEDRYPIQTYVLEYSEHLVREVVQRELNRQGQVFIVFNRIDRIDSFAARIKKMFPEALVAVGHGRMPESALEKVMAAFQEGAYDILVSTTIIESGLDIPNVNTLIVCDADRFGLAQLYQIRGRVGRSDRIAYAYLTYRKEKILSEVARERLKAIREFTELGSGLRIALRDLEIRGAGNILGAEQHGFINAVGFDLYIKLLDRAVSELKNSKSAPKPVTRIEVAVDAYLPSDYIADQSQKIDFYQRIHGSASREELHEIGFELAERYGTLPGVAADLIALAELRVLAADLGVEIIRLNGKVRAIFARGVSIGFIRIEDIAAVMPEILAAKAENPPVLEIAGPREGPLQVAGLVRLFEELLAQKRAAAGSCPP